MIEKLIYIYIYDYKELYLRFIHLITQKQKVEYLLVILIFQVL